MVACMYVCMFACMSAVFYIQACMYISLMVCVRVCKESPLHCALTSWSKMRTGRGLRTRSASTFSFWCFSFLWGGRFTNTDWMVLKTQKNKQTDGGVCWCQTCVSGSFPRTEREVLVGTKIQELNSGSNIWILAPDIWVLALYIWILSPYIWIWAPYIWIWRQNWKKRVFSKGGGGEVGGSPRTSGRFRHRCREKIFRPPLENSRNLVISRSEPDFKHRT